MTLASTIYETVSHCFMWSEALVYEIHTDSDIQSEFVA